MSNKPIYFGRGEDAVTEQSFLQLLATSAKRPVMYDFSHWRAIPDFSKLDPFPLLVITKATEGATYHDPTFIGYMTQMRDRGIHRGAFHFHRKAVSASAQATNFIEYTKGLLTDRDIICLDVEEGGETATQLMAWFQLIEARFPNNPLWIYSRKNILDAITMTQSQKDYFRAKVKTWTAGYPSNPDAYSFVPDFYVPDQTKYGPVVAWQYTDRLEVGGVVEGVVDANYMTPELIASLQDDPPTEPPTEEKAMFELRPAGTYNVTVRAAHPDAPILGGAIASIPNGTVGKADAKYIFEVDKYVNGVLRIKAGDIWCHVTEAQGKAVDGWAAEIHLGTRYLNVTEIAVVPVSMDIDLPKGATVTLTFSDGTKESWQA